MDIGKRDLGRGRKVVDISRRVIRVEDMDDETLALIMSAKVPKEAEALNYLMDDDAPIAAND